MSIWHKSMYGVGDGFEYSAGDPVAPIGPGLTKQSDWWFRGKDWMALPPQDNTVMDLPAGGKIDIEIACNVAWTTYGARTTDPDADLSACPDNYGAHHAGDPAGPIEDDLLSGCALGLADVDDINDVTIDNLAIFSVNRRCVRQRITTFEIPEKMPACSSGKCICAWFWLANTGTANFYMTGFDCSVSGSPADALPIAAPQDPVYCGDDSTKCVQGSKKPLYAYNTPTNVPAFGNDWRPGYHATWSFPNDGAQNDIFETLGSSSSTGGSSSSSTSTRLSTSSRSAYSPSLALSATGLVSVDLDVSAVSTSPANEETASTSSRRVRVVATPVSTAAIDLATLSSSNRTRAWSHTWTGSCSDPTAITAVSDSSALSTSASHSHHHGRHRGGGWRWKHRHASSSPSTEALSTSTAHLPVSTDAAPSSANVDNIASQVVDATFTGGMAAKLEERAMVEEKTSGATGLPAVSSALDVVLPFFILICILAV
ncbi:hypothetical protein JCM8547_000656 [Rhodosporidiobolus lusitaniae]